MQARAFTLALCLAALPAAAQQIDDPANLMGERVSAPALADTLPINHGAPALEQLLRKLRTRASMMLIVAHPDDEDSGLLTYESRGMGARAAMLTLTRGEGGQNLMSADFNDALGLIRTQELLAEDRYTGTDQFFGTEVDFGFSKTKEETLKQWGHDRVLYDAVRAVRLYRPLVLASVFVGGPTDGHGQHQVSGEISQEVFVAAADPKVFPEMGLPAWAPLRVYARVPFSRVGPDGMFDYATGRTIPTSFHNYVTGVTMHTAPEASVTVHEGDKPGILAFHDLSYVQWARQGLALQKSQIGANFRIPPAGVADVGYTLMGSRTGCIAQGKGAGCLDPESRGAAKLTGAPGQAEDLFTGIDTSLPALAGLAPSAPASFRETLQEIDAKIAEAQRLYDPAHVELTAPPLRDALKALDELIHQTEGSKLERGERFNLLHELRVKRVQLNNALVLALGISVDAKAARELVYTSDASLPVSVEVKNSAKEKLSLSGLQLAVNSTANAGLADVGKPLEAGSEVETRGAFEIGRNQHATEPYFSRKDLAQPFYDVSDPSLRNAPMTPDPFVARARIRDGVVLEVASIAHVPASDRKIEQAAVLVPPVSIAVHPSAGIYPLTNPALKFGTAVSSSKVALTAPPQLQLPARWRAAMMPAEPLDGTTRQEWNVVPEGVRSGETARITAVETESSQRFSEGYRPVGYAGLTTTNYYSPATFKAVAVDVTTAPNLRIAYLAGTGDEVAQFLPWLGVKPTMITTKDLGGLSQYDAVILGVRAYSAHPELEGAGSQALLDYAKAGGVVIAQYNSAGFDPGSAPFPYTLPGDSAHNVVDEDQPVTLLQPENPLLTWPNRITPHDFDHWIEERGHGFASDWAGEYASLLETHDLEQDPQKGGLLLARVGKGAYIYCALALYRQLPEGVPGAYRLMANLVSYAKNPGR